MKLILAIVNKDDETDTISELNKNQFFVTKLATTGGFLNGKNTTLMIGTGDERVAQGIEIIQKMAGSRTAKMAGSPPMTSGGLFPGAATIPVDVQTGGATVFVLNVEQFEKL